MPLDYTSANSTISKYLSLYPEIGAVLTPYQGNFPLQQMDTILENRSRSKCGAVEPSPNGSIYKELRLSGHCRRGVVGRSCKSQRIREFAVGLCPLAMSESTLMKSRQDDCLNISRMRTTTDMPKWMGEGPRGFNPTQETIGHGGMLRRGESLPQGKAHQLVIQYQMASPENTHASNIIQTEQVIFRCICVSTYIQMHVTTKRP